MKAVYDNDDIKSLITQQAFLSHVVINSDTSGGYL